MPTATAENPLASDTAPHSPRTRHLPRRTVTATTTLRAIDSRALELGPQREDAATAQDSGQGSARGSTQGSVRSPRPSRAEDSERRAVRSLSPRELVTGAGTTAGAWTLASHLGLLGTATGTFLISLVSTLGVALVADSLTGARRALLRLVRRLRERRAHRQRSSRSRLTPPS
ncbi:hypothetical protein DEO23_03330 [Brachybacterium endophyticum]|uniref:Uncharacterized protein n=1 Tax=Brachybacterium endophyticum TaxID=2182385 RepID=A0A2U2RP50_9MICO|nr:hypothetical protein [Brachybacterium endophyticum]PWH07668.1 hypothetical protein DEO23_03330 [Brachybacterium endophyticum]